jgi:hypothetical protein
MSSDNMNATPLNIQLYRTKMGLLKVCQTQTLKKFAFLRLDKFTVAEKSMFFRAFIPVNFCGTSRLMGDGK